MPNKAELIKSLAESVGFTENIDLGNSTSRYDPNTGTLYCEGIQLPHSSIERIKNWYYQQMVTYRNQMHSDTLKREYYMRYALAYNAICMLKDNLDN